MNYGECMRSLLLAGGRSSRMGRDKALIEVGGVACIARVASALAAAGCEPIRIAVAQPEDVERYGAVMPDRLDVEWVLDAVTHAGPIEALIEALTDPLFADTGSIQLCPVDVPWVTADLFFELEKTLCKKRRLHEHNLSRGLCGRTISTLETIQASEGAGHETT